MVAVPALFIALPLHVNVSVIDMVVVRGDASLLKYEEKLTMSMRWS